MVFNPLIPQPNDRFSKSQNDLLTNNGDLDTSFGIDHYPFSNLTTDNGKHNQVTTPIIVGGLDPTTGVNEPKFYARVPYTAIGALQFSRGGSNAVPTPVTSLHSSAVPINIGINTTIPVLDFVGMGNVWFTFLVTSVADFMPPQSRTNYNLFHWTGSVFVKSLIVEAASGTRGIGVGSVLSILNFGGATASNVFWTIQFIRIA